MKKTFSMAFALILLVFSAPAQVFSTPTQTSDFPFSVDYGNSKVFNKSEMNKCISVIEKKLTETGCTLKRVRYVGDEISNSEENIKYMNWSAKGRNFREKFIQCMTFETDFQSPPDPRDGKPTAWRYDTEYRNYGWQFGLYEVDGEWKLLAWGYC